MAPMFGRDEKVKPEKNGREASREIGDSGTGQAEPKRP